MDMASSKDFLHASRLPRPSKQKHVDLPALQNASKVIQEQFVKDSQIIPDLGETTTASGIQASESYSIFFDDTRVPYQKRKFIPIPHDLLSLVENSKETSQLGLMPELDLAWISVDHRLFLWDYNDEKELISFVDQSDIITSVTLVRPKAAVFVEEISHLLVICTPYSVFLLGLSVKSGPGDRLRNTIQFFATDINVPTRVDIFTVVGMPDGRIFMASAQDGCLYELFYQREEAWLGGKVQLINHSVKGVQSLLPRFLSDLAAYNNDDRIMVIAADASRGCLYTVSINNALSVYKPDGAKALQYVQTLSNIYKAAQEKAPGFPTLTQQSFQIVSLHVVEPQESRSSIQLLAITTGGIRLYFAPTYGSTHTTTNNTIRPLQLAHVRFPPPNLLHPDEQAHIQSVTSHGQPLRPRAFVMSNIENTCYHNGLLAAAQYDSDGSDHILCASPDLTQIGSLGQLSTSQQGGPGQQPQQIYGTYGGGGYVTSPSRRPLTENASLLSIPGRTWAIASSPREVTTVPPNTPSPSVINELGRQFTESSQQFMVLTTSGISFLRKRRALDYLRAVVEELQSGNSVKPIIDFRDSFGRDQMCSMLLALSAGNVFLDGTMSPSGTVAHASPEIVAIAKQVFYDFAERPVWSERITYGTADTQGTTSFSGRREGFVLYFARLVRPAWKAKLTKIGPSDKHQLNISEHTLNMIHRNLVALKEFLDRNSLVFHASPGDTASNLEALKAEQLSITELTNLLSRTIEGLSFVLLLNDYQIDELISRCDKTTQKMIAGLTLEDLITTQNGMTISRALVNAVIDQQSGQQISIDTISEVIQRRCGSFCGTDDVMLYKARESIQKAVETRSSTEGQKWLVESLQLFIKGSRILGFEKLREIIGDYQQLNYAEGAIRLPLICTCAFDPDNVGLEYWLGGSPANDPRQEQANLRIQCYGLIMDSLSVFEEKCNAKKQTQSLLGLDDPEAVRSSAYELAFASDDEMFQSILYDWLIGRGFADDLLQMRPKYLEAHLTREPVTMTKHKLLWQFYSKNGEPLRAAEILLALADSKHSDISMSSRLEYLTLAMANAKAHSASGHQGAAVQLLEVLEEKLDVYQVQAEMFNTLSPHMKDAPEVGQKIQLLSKYLMNMTELYQGYAVPFQLPTLQLLCIHVSGYEDESLVQSIWTQMFESAFNEKLDAVATAAVIQSRIVPLAQRFRHSKTALPLRYVVLLFSRFMLTHKTELPSGWVPRMLVQCGLSLEMMLDIFTYLYESQTSPYNDPANAEVILSDIALVLNNWFEDVSQTESSIDSRAHALQKISFMVNHRLKHFKKGQKEIAKVYNDLKHKLQQRIERGDGLLDE